MVDFKPNLFDRALSVIAPTTATRRLAARVAFGNLARAYAGQSQGRLSGDWRAPPAEISTYCLPVLGDW